MHRYEKWRQAIAIAPNPTAVEKLVREYVDCILPSEVTNVPEACRAILASPTTDIALNAVTLLQEELKFQGDAETAATLHEIAHTFAAASTRLTQMHTRYMTA